jgi:translation initiation factor IF-2
MTDKKDNTNKKSTLTLSSSKLKLGDIKGGQVSQSLSHGRAKNVQVEVRKKRRFASASSNENSVSKEEVKNEAKGSDGLTDSEREKRLKVLQQASDYEKEKSEKEAEQAKIAQQRAEEKALKEKEEAEEAAKLAEELKKKRDSKKAAEQKIDNPAISQNDSVKPIKSNDKLSLTVKEKTKKDRDEKEERKPAPVRSGESKRRSGKLTIAQALSDNGEERMRSLASVRRAREKARKAAEADNTPKEKRIRDVTIPEIITVQELANRMAERAVDVTKVLMKMGMMVTANQTIDADTAELVVEEFGHRTRRVTDADVEDILKDDGTDNEDNLIHKAPVVTFMGHVDHGKTSLLDKIREAKVASGEAGGITQHIGAYQVEVDKDHKITFLDTPGHEAFTAMRQRGANATDIVVLVVAADDGIMAQTVEAINHAKAAGVPIIIAINKIDKPDADPARVRTSLLEHELVTEDMGGDILAVEVSAKSGDNLDKLLEAILIQAEMLELTSNPDRKASGIVVEARVDKNKGVVSTLLVQRGTLEVSDIVIVGEAFGKVRAMKSAEGRTLQKAGPSVPVEILGLDQAPEAGVEFHVVDSEKQAREIKEYRQKRSRDLKVAMQQKKGTLEDLFLQAKDGGKKELPVVIKGDVQGSVEAIIGSLEKLENDEVTVRPLHTAVGAISTSDITLAAASNAVILGFNVRADASARELAQKEGADIRYYSIIYDLIDDIKAILGGMLDPHVREQYLGNAEIREVFTMSKYGKVAGCYVTDGVIKRGSGVRLLRDNVVIHEGKLKTLKRFKDDVKEVGTNFECGMAFENYEDLKAGDTIEAFELIEEQRSL